MKVNKIYSNAVRFYETPKMYNQNIGVWGANALDIKESLSDNTTTNINIGTVNQHEIIRFDYTIKRANGYAIGSIDLINGGGIIVVNEPDGRNIYGNTSIVNTDAISISADTYNYNIRLKISLLDNHGSAVVNIFNIKQIAFDGYTTTTIAPTTTLLSTTTQAITTTLLPTTTIVPTTTQNTTTGVPTTTILPTTTNTYLSIADSFNTYIPNSQLHTNGNFWIKTNPENNSFRVLESGGAWVVQSHNINQFSSLVRNVSGFSENHDVYARLTANSGGAGYYVGVGVRMSTFAETYYAYVGNNIDSKLIKMVNGVETILSTGGSWIYGNNYKLMVSGNTLMCYNDTGNNLIFNLNTSISTDGIYVDNVNPLTSGNPGLVGYGDSTGLRLDNWSATELSIMN